jgi:dihydropteroate synthase
VVDVGGESSRPGADPVDAATETARVVPVVEALAAHVRVSVDTAKPDVAHAAIDAGADLLNDITASLWPVAAERSVGWVAMHMRGEPRTMQDAPRYRDVVGEVRAFLCERAERARAAGIDEVWIDPGIGFGKRFEHNWALLAAVGELAGTGWPVAVGSSRKGFLGALLGEADGLDVPVPVDDRLEASVATAVLAARAGAAMVRVHDVATTVAALDAVGSGQAA